MEATLGRVASEACEEMATDPVPTRMLRRQETLWLMPAFLLEVCIEPWPQTGMDGHG
jgi:hypothetical protein